MEKQVKEVVGSSGQLGDDPTTSGSGNVEISQAKLEEMENKLNSLQTAVDTLNSAKEQASLKIDELSKKTPEIQKVDVVKSYHPTKEMKDVDMTYTVPAGYSYLLCFKAGWGATKITGLQVWDTAWCPVQEISSTSNEVYREICIGGTGPKTFTMKVCDSEDLPDRNNTAYITGIIMK